MYRTSFVTITNMAAVRNFEVISGKLDGKCTCTYVTALHNNKNNKYVGLEIYNMKVHFFPCALNSWRDV
jgi:hypothetical protein